MGESGDFAVYFSYEKNSLSLGLTHDVSVSQKNILYWGVYDKYAYKYDREEWVWEVKLLENYAVLVSSFFLS